MNLLGKSVSLPNLTRDEDEDCDQSQLSFDNTANFDPIFYLKAKVEQDQLNKHEQVLKSVRER